MRYEHLMQVTDPGNPVVPPMSRAELWRGLLMRVESPQRFPLGPDRCRCEVGGHAGERKREIRYGALRFEDTVTLEPERRIVFRPEPHEGASTVVLQIDIEEPQPGALFLRFVYDWEPLSDGEAALQRYREQAWLEHDRDMLRALREWQRDGVL